MSEVWYIWVDWEKRIVSFQEAAGFQRLAYPTHEEMFQFAIGKTMEGFAVQ